MKTPVLALGIAAAAFASSSFYLWSQLREERARAAQVEDATRKLNERIAQLEKARTPFSSPVVKGDAVVAGQARQETGKDAAATSPIAAPDPGAVAQWSQDVQRYREPPEAMQKMMRAQMRAMNRQQYAEICAALGLDKETTDKLMTLMAEQAMRPFEPGAWANPADLQGQMKERQRIEQSEIADLIGADKAQALQDYKDSVPARAEADMLAQQLEGNDVPLNDGQMKKLRQVFVEERARVPAPELEAGNDPLKYMHAMNDWQDDYNRRVAERANHILSAEQQRVYSEIQQWQDQMRKGWTTSMPMDAAVSGAGTDNFFVVQPAGVVPGVALQGVAVSATVAPAQPAAPANEEPRKKP
jgi:hypothetical protein